MNEELSLKITKLGLLITIVVSAIVYIFRTNDFEKENLIFLILFSLISLILVSVKRSLLNFIQFVSYLIIIFTIFLIAYNLQNPLILLWIYLSLLSSFLILPKKQTIFIFLFSLSLICFYIEKLQVNHSDCITLVLSLIAFFTFGYYGFSLYEKYEKDLAFLAKFDPLTEIFNRRAFFQIASNLEKPKGLLILDLDYFKKINDNYGHDMGDKVLKKFVKIISIHIGEEDIFARIGGEEFVIILKNIKDKKELFKKAEELREKIKNGDFFGINVTVSIGGTIFNHESIDEALKEADKCLYKAKKTRNRSEICN